MMKLQNIVKTYNSDNAPVIALNNLTAQFKRGEFVSVIGKSGSGKSTLLNIIGCIDKPDSGEYYFENRKITQFNAAQLSALRCKYFGFVFQSFYLLPDFNVFQNITMPLKYSKTPKKQYAETAMPIIEHLGLQDYIKRYPRQLSGGEQQRVAFARSLINNPEIILADEPTGNLDTENSERIIELLLQAQSTFNKTIILITHDAKIASYADRILQMKDGILNEVH